MEHGEDWISPEARTSISNETCLRFRTYESYVAAGYPAIARWSKEYASAIGRDGVTPDDVRRWIELRGAWTGSRGQVTLELRWVRDVGVAGGARCDWRFCFRRQWHDGSALNPYDALMQIGVLIRGRLAARHNKAREERAA